MDLDFMFVVVVLGLLWFYGCEMANIEPEQNITEPEEQPKACLINDDCKMWEECANEECILWNPLNTVTDLMK